ncbi:MAG: AraC family transcriptional regulator [Candidatus Saccharibacteria bacterium]|nr:AraC family transcriptional regulator [Pseudorhodobacter sp.]
MLSDLLAHGHDIRALPRGGTGLHCMAASVGYEQRTQELYNWDGMKRGFSPFLVIQHTILGEGRLTYGGTDHTLRPGQTMLVTVPHAHRYWLERGGHWEYFWAILHGREAMRLAREILDTAGPVLTLGPNVNRLASACLTLLTAPLTPGQASDAAYQAMTALHDACFGAGHAATPLPPAMKRVTDFIAAHLSEPLPIDRLATIAGLSRAHFSRAFTACFGVPPSDYVTAQRMDRIERLLLATEMTVTDIARATGFADPNYLAKAFRRHRGMAPLQFRATRAETV